MSGFTWAVITFATLWLMLLMTFGIAARMVERRMDDLDELHAWREKVEAMRRLNDTEGRP